jgi:hypothetical protein
MEREVLVRNDGSVWLKHRSIVSALNTPPPGSCPPGEILGIGHTVSAGLLVQPAQLTN